MLLSDTTRSKTKICPGYSIFTQGEDWNDLKAMARDAVLCHFDEDDVPRTVRLHLVREEAIAV